MATPIVTGSSPLGLSLRSLFGLSRSLFWSLIGWRVAIRSATVAVSVAVSPHWLARCRQIRHRCRQRCRQRSQRCRITTLLPIFYRKRCLLFIIVED